MKAITTKYLGPTNNRGSRIKAYDCDNNQVTLPYRSELNSEDRTMENIVDMQEIKSHARGHFFDPGASRFFLSRYPQTGYRKGDKVYFITSEQFVGSDHVAAPRRYTIRVLDYKTGDVDTVSEFNKMTRSGAHTALKHILEEAQS